MLDICPCYCFLFLLNICPYVLLLFCFMSLIGCFLILVATSCPFVALGNNFLFMCKGIMFPSLPVSTLNGNIISTWSDNVSHFLLLLNACYQNLDMKELMIDVLLVQKVINNSCSVN